jgi:DNA-binding NtrC family response regulator
VLLGYLPETNRSRLPVRVNSTSDGFEEGDAGRNEREILYKVLFDMKGELNDLKDLVLGLVNSGKSLTSEEQVLVNRLLKKDSTSDSATSSSDTFERKSNFPIILRDQTRENTASPIIHDLEEVEQSLSLVEVERQLIKKALEKHSNRRKDAAEELGISERTLYRKIKEYDLK